MLRDLLADQRQVLGTEHPDTMATRHNLGWMIEYQGRYSQAEHLLKELLADQEEILGGNHSHALGTRHRLAWLAEAQGRHKEAEQIGSATSSPARRPCLARAIQKPWQSVTTSCRPYSDKGGTPKPNMPAAKSWPTASACSAKTTQLCSPPSTTSHGWSRIRADTVKLNKSAGTFFQSDGASSAMIIPRP